MKHIIVAFLPLLSCTSQNDYKTKLVEKVENKINEDSLSVIEFYNKNSKIENSSKSLGTVSKGSLEFGKIIPFCGKNFTYFDRDSYLASRAFTSDAVKSIILNTYDSLYVEFPTRKFYLMELSHQNGGKLFPHRTHQNGLSVDFMLPKLKNTEANYELDTLGKNHYFLQFNDEGKYSEDPSIVIDFDLVAKHILLLNQEARKIGYGIEKVIIKVEYKDELFATPNGKLLKESGIYIVKSLTSEINAIHDDHFHVDFVKK